MARRAGRGFRGVVSASAGRRGLVLLHHAGWDAPALTDRDAMVFRPGPDIAAALAAGPGTPRPAGLRPPGLAGMLDERHELLAERGGVLLIQVNLIVAPPKANRIVSAAGPPSRSSSSATVTLWAISPSHLRSCLQPTHSGLPGHSRNAADQGRNPGEANLLSGTRSRGSACLFPAVCDALSSSTISARFIAESVQHEHMLAPSARRRPQAGISARRRCQAGSASVPVARCSGSYVRIHLGQLTWPSTWTDRVGRDRTPSIPGQSWPSVSTPLGPRPSAIQEGASHNKQCSTQ